MCIRDSYYSCSKMIDQNLSCVSDQTSIYKLRRMEKKRAELESMDFADQKKLDKETSQERVGRLVDAWHGFRNQLACIRSPLEGQPMLRRLSSQSHAEVFNTIRCIQDASHERPALSASPLPLRGLLQNSNIQKPLHHEVIKEYQASGSSLGSPLPLPLPHLPQPQPQPTLLPHPSLLPLPVSLPSKTTISQTQASGSPIPLESVNKTNHTARPLISGTKRLNNNTNDNSGYGSKTKIKKLLDTSCDAGFAIGIPKDESSKSGWPPALNSERGMRRQDEELTGVGKDASTTGHQRERITKELKTDVIEALMKKTQETKKQLKEQNLSNSNNINGSETSAGSQGSNSTSGVSVNIGAAVKPTALCANNKKIVSANEVAAVEAVKKNAIPVPVKKPTYDVQASPRPRQLDQAPSLRSIKSPILAENSVQSNANITVTGVEGKNNNANGTKKAEPTNLLNRPAPKTTKAAGAVKTRFALDCDSPSGTDLGVNVPRTSKKRGSDVTIPEPVKLKTTPNPNEQIVVRVKPLNDKAVAEKPVTPTVMLSQPLPVAPQDIRRPKTAQSPSSGHVASSSHLATNAKLGNILKNEASRSPVDDSNAQRKQRDVVSTSKGSTSFRSVIKSIERFIEGPKKNEKEKEKEREKEKEKERQVHSSREYANLVSANLISHRSPLKSRNERSIASPTPKRMEKKGYTNQKFVLDTSSPAFVGKTSTSPRSNANNARPAQITDQAISGKDLEGAELIDFIVQEKTKKILTMLNNLKADTKDLFGAVKVINPNAQPEFVESHLTNQIETSLESIHQEILKAIIKFDNQNMD
eukprot:TRINITY_DN6923_c0_g5_i1.p1 TRINITY_DN6923_c0_g5~~TRINITY_DN6923_c0_g5_i1.p1  ORF type:complete len:829 (-),score=100.38 TRINITY_DN6923_c0_g5_i1:373-2814(-)